MNKTEAYFKKQNLLKGNVITLSFTNNISSPPFSFRANVNMFELSFLTNFEVGNGKSILISLIYDISIAPTIINESILNLFVIELILRRLITVLCQYWTLRFSRFWCSIFVFHRSIKWKFLFFLSGFSFTTITNPRSAGEGEGNFLTPHYHFHPLHRHLDIRRAITAGSSPLHLGSSRTRTGNLWFLSASR